MTDRHRPGPLDEPRAVVERYARRSAPDRYSPLRPEVWQGLQERQRAMLRGFAARGWHDLSGLGARPEGLTGLELLPERHAAARHALPAAATVWLGDATQAPVTAASQDVVLQSTVFSSLLDDHFQQRLADTMWAWLKPGGAVLWYDFTVDNPRNPDVRGVPLPRVRQLFPQGQLSCRRVTLAPPLARAACRVHPALYGVLNAVPLLRTHVLAWIGKP